MLSLLLVAGAASGEFLTPIKSHHHQESLNLKESAGKKPHDNDCQEQDCILKSLAGRVIVVRDEMQEAVDKKNENNAELLRLGAQTVARKASFDDRSSKLKTTRGVTQAASALMDMKNASSTETSQTHRSSMEAGSSTGAGAFPSASQFGRQSVIGNQTLGQTLGQSDFSSGASRNTSMGAGSSHTGAGVGNQTLGQTLGQSAYPSRHSQFGRESVIVSVESAQRGVPIQHQVSGSRAPAPAAPAAGFGFGNGSSTQGGYPSGSGWDDCPTFGKAYKRCVCKSINNGSVTTICHEGESCIRGQDSAKCTY